eukprot:symbB.v1.2.012075.t1/scaffold822.1/size350215/2
MLCAALCMADVLPMPLVFNAPIAGFEEQCPMGFWICTSGFLVTLLGLLSTPYWPISCSRDMAFVDVASIHQSDKRLMERGVFGIAGFLRVSKELRILHSIPYFARLWCVFECAAYRKVNPDGRIVFKPLFVERITFYLWASTYFFNFLYFIMREYGSAAGRQFTNLASFTVPFGVSCYALRMNFREEKHQLLSHLEKFQLDQVQCSEEFDRNFIHQAIVKWYGSKESFQDFVKGEFREDLAKALSTQLPFGYLLLLVTPHVSMSCEYMLAMLKTNISWSSLMIYICAVTIGFSIFWTLAALLLMVDLCDRYAPRRFGCFDHVQTFLIVLLVVFMFFAGFLAASTACLISMEASGLYLLCAVVFCATVACWNMVRESVHSSSTAIARRVCRTKIEAEIGIARAVVSETS